MMGTMTEHPLADLVRQAHDDEGLSYREMAARAHRAGHEISHSQLAAYANHEVSKAPTPKQMHALAAALNVGYETVEAAMFREFYGYVPRGMKDRPNSRIAAAVPPDLPKEKEEEFMRLLEAWLATWNRENG